MGEGERGDSEGGGKIKKSGSRLDTPGSGDTEGRRHREGGVGAGERGGERGNARGEI